MYNPINTVGVGKKLAGFAFVMFGFISVYGQGQIHSITRYSNKVTQVSSNTPTTPAGTGTTFFMGREQIFVFGGPSIYFNYRSLLQFDFSDIQPNAIVTSATLTLTRSGGINPMNIIVARAASAWAESTATWNNQPAPQSVDEITIPATNSNMTIDVKNHIQKMVAQVYTNNGWVLRGSVESGSVGTNRHFYSDHYSVSTSHPKLQISYYIPMSVASATITHQSLETVNDGAISPVLADGPGGTYTYRWYNSAGSVISTSTTSPNLTGVSSGWYGLQVSSSVSGTAPFYYAFLVGRNCAVVPIEFNPGPNYIDDAVLQGPNSSPSSFENYGSDGYESALDQIFFGSPLEWKSPIRFRLWIDPTLNVNTATLRLKGAHNQSDRSNASIFRRITSNWNESIVTYSSTPTVSNDITLNIPELTSPTEEKFLNILEFCEYWQQNNNQNFGFLFELLSYNGILATHRYYSSDVAAANRPKIDFLVGFSSPSAPHYCNQVFAKMDRNLRGVRYKPHQNHLYFYYEEEYDSPDVGLNYRVYADNNPMTTLIGHTTDPLTEIEYGDNRYVLNVSQLPSGFYILEIVNNKKEKYYLRFKIED